MRLLTTTLALLFLVGCAPGKSVVTITLDGDASMPVGPIASVSVTPSDAAGHKDTITIPVNGATIPPAYTFSLRFDASVKGAVHVAVVALDDGGGAIGSASGDVEVKPSQATTLPLTLTALVPPPGGSTLSFTTQPTDALAKSALAAVKVAVVDGNGSPVTSTNLPITLAIGTNPSGGVLAGTLTVNATQGVATFSDLTIDKAGTGYTLVASAPGLTDLASAAFNVKSDGWVAVNSGLSGGVINDLVMDPKHPTTLYAATADNGVWRTTDGGANWARASNGLPPRTSVDALALDPVTTTTIWATCNIEGIFKSTDSGNSWVRSYSLGVSGLPYAAIAVDKAHPSVVYASDGKAVQRTTDGGANWNPIQTNATYGGGPRSIAIHPTTGDVYVAHFGDGLAKMPYNGTTFTALNGTGANIIPGTHPYMKCIGFDPSNPSYMFATGDTSPTVFTSSDNGVNWVAATTAPAKAPVKIAGVSVAGGSVRMYGAIPELGIISTPTAPTKWDYGSMGISGAVAVAVDPNVPNLVYAATPIGVFKSTDSFNFTGDYNGLIGHGAYSLAVDPKNGMKVYVGMRNGLFRSTDGGQSWSPPTSAMPGNTAIFALAVDYNDDKQLYLGTSNWGYHSADFGATWSQVTYGTTIAPIYSLAASPSQAATFYAGGNAGDAYSIAGSASTWSPAGSGLPAASRVVGMVVHPTNPMQVWAVLSGAGVYKTTNGGASWTAASSGVPPMTTGIAIDPMTPTTLYVATDQGVWKSTDGGGSWSRAWGALGAVMTSAIAVAPSQPSVVYAATPMGVYQSLDGGASWALFSAGLVATDISALGVDPNDPRTAFAATWDGGVFKSVTQ